MSSNTAVFGFVSAAVLVVSIPRTQSVPTCDQWNTQEFLETATVEDVTACLAAGAGVDARDDRDLTPLHWAAFGNQDPAVIRALLSAGADPAARASNVIDITPLHAAAQGNDNPAVLGVLLAAGADPMARTTDGRTAMHFAAAFIENAEVIKALVSAGADPDASDEEGDTPLHGAAARANPAVIVIETLLAVGADPDASDEEGDTPLHRAARFNENTRVLEMLLAAGADPNARGRDGDTPLHRTAGSYSANAAVGEVLLAAGADPNARGRDGDTPLHRAAASDSANAAVGKVLLAAGGDPNARGRDGDTPLHRAAVGFAANAAVAEVLLAAGADPNVVDDEGNTPLHLGAYGRSGLAIEALLGAGADASLRNAAGLIPWDFARRNLRLLGSYAYLWLSDLRADRPGSDARRAPAAGRTTLAPLPDRTELADRISEARETSRSQGQLVYVSDVLFSVQDSPELDITTEFSIVGPVFRSNVSDTLTIRATPRASQIEHLLDLYSDHPVNFMLYGTDEREFYRNGSLFFTGGPLGGELDDIDGICLEPETEQLRLLTATWSGGAPDPMNHWVLSFNDSGVDYARLSAIDGPVAPPVDCADDEVLWQRGSRFRPCICTGRASNIHHYAAQDALFRDIQAVTTVSDSSSGINDHVLTDLAEKILALRASAAWDSAAEIGMERFQSDEFEVLVIHYRHFGLADAPFQYVFARAVDREVWHLLYDAPYSSKSLHFATIHGFADDETLELDACVEGCSWWGHHKRVQWHLRKRLASVMGGN